MLLGCALLVQPGGRWRRVLGPASALLTYRAAHRQPDGSLTRHTLRSSVWRLEAEGWQLFYHQGTPAEVVW